MHRHGRVLDVKVSSISILLRQKVTTTSGKRRVKERLGDHPVIHLSSWCQQMLEKYPRYILGEYCPEKDGHQSYMDMFASFWINYCILDRDHPVREKSLEELQHTIPIAIHGDEGRGLSKVPVMCISYQLLIPSSGPDKLNCSQSLSAELILL